MLKMDQVHVLRHKVLDEGRSIRRVARELGISRNTVAKYLEQSEPVRGPTSSQKITRRSLLNSPLKVFVHK
jgi:predicted transcriptional regulator